MSSLSPRLLLRQEPWNGNLGDLNRTAGHLACHQDLASHDLCSVNLWRMMMTSAVMIIVVRLMVMTIIKVALVINDHKLELWVQIQKYLPTCPKNASKAVLFRTEALPSVPCQRKVWNENYCNENWDPDLHKRLTETSRWGPLFASLVHCVNSITADYYKLSYIIIVLLSLLLCIYIPWSIV